MDKLPWAGTRRLLFDIGLAIAAMVFALGLAISLSDGLPAGRRTWALILLGIHTLALALRRIVPQTVFWTNLGTGVGVALLGLPTVVLHLTPLIALYSVAAQVPRSRSLVALGATLLALVATAAINGFDEDPSTLIGNVVGIASVWAAGHLVLGRQTYVRQLEARTQELEEAREELAEKIAAEERVRIARELHDIVAHSLSVIAVQSGVGAHVIDQRPEEARRALMTIEDASRRALQEMRGLLSVLRNGDSADKMPLPGITQIEELITQVDGTGVGVELQVNGDIANVPPAIDLTAYRIVQESLTNVVKHAAARRARVVLSFTKKDMTIDIVDDGRGEPSRAIQEGQGLRGMRERVEMFDGSFLAEAMEDGGFHIHARLPIGAPT